MLCYVLYCIHADSTRSYLQGILPSFISTINYHFQVPAAAAEVRLDEGDGGADGVGWGGMWIGVGEYVALGDFYGSTLLYNKYLKTVFLRSINNNNAANP